MSWKGGWLNQRSRLVPLERVTWMWCSRATPTIARTHASRAIEPSDHPIGPCSRSAHGTPREACRQVGVGAMAGSEYEHPAI